MIKIYSSLLLDDPVECHEPSGGTLHDWLAARSESYRPGPVQPWQASIGGRVVPPTEWQALVLQPGLTIELRPVPLDGGLSLWVVGALLVGAVAVALLLRPALPKNNTRTARELSAADINANLPRLNGVIPEIAGQYRVYPDYLCQPRRYFVDKNTQAIDLMLCVGVGEYQIDALRIGETDADEFGDGVDSSVFGPGADVTGHQAHRNWYNCPNVGATTGGAGIRLTSGVAGTASAEADSYTLTGDSIVVLPGAGALPQDWEIGTVVSIRAWTASIEIIDNGGSVWAPNRDTVRCDLTGMPLVIDDVITIDGAGANDGRYKVVSVTTGIVEAGSASTIQGVITAGLNYDAVPITLYIAGQAVLLDEDYADAAALAAAIDSQVAGVTVSIVSGAVLVTDDSPFDGQNITLSGNYAPVFGATPYFVAGTASRSYDELTLDRWTETMDPGSGEMVTGWMSSGSMMPGVYAGVALQKPRIKTATAGASTVTQYMPTEYRIVDVVTGALPDASTGNVGYELQRLNPDGTDDASWSGFFPETTTAEVEMLFAAGIVGGWTGWFDVSPGAEIATRLEDDFFFPAGLGRFNRDGKLKAFEVAIEVQYRIDGGTPESHLHTFYDATVDQLGYTFGTDLPAGAQRVQKRVRRIGAEPGGSNYMARCEWYGSRALLTPAESYDGVTTIALTIVGSDKLAAQTENKVNCVVTRKFDGVASRNIDDWVRYVASDVGYSGGDINESELTALGDLWSARGDTYDAAIVDQTTVKDTMSDALRAGFAELTIDNGQIRPVRDQPRTDIEHMYSPQNMLNPLRQKFRTRDPDDYDGVDVEFTSAETWAKEVVQCRLPGDVGVRVEKIRVDGVTDRTKAWRIGMRQRRSHQYRNRDFDFSTEWDALNSRYLSYCVLSDDVPGYGQSALVVSWSPADDAGGTLIVSEPLRWVDGDSHVIALRRPDGTVAGPIDAMPGADEFTVLLADDLDFDPITGGAEEPTHVLFGTLTRWSYPVLITGIDPAGETVDVTAIKYDPRIYLDDDNAPPA